MTTRLVDDLDGSEAVATVSFSLDGRGFEIDLSEGHVSELRDALEPFVTAARRVSGDDRPPRSTGRRPANAGGAAAPARDRTAPARDRTAPARDAAAPARDETAVASRSEGEPAAPTPRGAEVAPAPSMFSPPRGRQEETDRSEGSGPRQERKPAPLVADPFNP